MHARQNAVFFCKSSILMVPLVLIVVGYFIFDPFKVLYSYQHYYDADVGIALNRDYVTTEQLKSRLAQGGLDSFIFGSSRSLAFLCRDWAQHISPGNTFHFDASGESLYGIWSKIHYLDDRGTPVRNALLVLDRFGMANVHNSGSHLLIKHPDVSHESRLVFQSAFFKAYLSRSIAILCFEVFSTRPPLVGDFLHEGLQVDPVTNDVVFVRLDEELGRCEEEYYRKRVRVFYPRDTAQQTAAEPVITQKQIEMLRDIKAVFDKHGTEYRIIISPLYDQVKLNRADVENLAAVFGERYTFDFSGVNCFTSNRRNYYETSHFRPQVAREILDIVYCDGSNAGRPAGHTCCEMTSRSSPRDTQ